MRDESGKAVLVGVTTFGPFPLFGLNSMFGRVSAVRKWIWANSDAKNYDCWKKN